MDYPLWDVPLRRLNSVTFRILSGDEIKAISVKEINNPKTFDALLHAQNGGLHDLALGAFERNEVCSTCGQIGVYCPGHMGHIQLPLPVFSPGIFLSLFTLLRGSCFNCHRLLISGFEKSFYKSKIALLDHGLLLSIKSLEDKAALILLAADNKARNISNMDCESLEAFAEDCIKTEKTEWVALRNIESIRNAVINQLTKKMISPVKKCLHCCSSLARIKQVKQCKVFMVNRTENSMHKCRRDSGKGSIEEICEESDSGEDDPESLKGDKVYITPIDARNHLREVWKHEGPLLKCLYGSLSNNLQHPTDIFFMDIIPVAPSRFRPFAVIRDTKLEHSQTSNLAALLRESESIRTILNDIATEKEPLAETTSADKVSLPLGIVRDNSTKLVEERLLAAWTNAQIYTNCIMDKNLHISPNNFVGIKQLLEKKDGLFRKHMMGKRVNFAARSVITPDPCISTFEVGIPEVFAKNLTYPQTVTPWNVQKLRQLVINGPLVYPGAESVINERGFKMRLPTNKTSREVIAKQLLTPSTQTDLSESKKVCRHLLSGDFLLLNRQPTLHKPSMQCHKARVLANTKTFRLHYANCKAYNADFDGDEMNAHFPQNEMARAEASVISSTEFQYLVPKDGTPLAGLIQDHVVAGVMLTIRGQFFNRVDYNHLVYSALVDKNESIVLLPPAVLKPYQLWSGKQVVSTILSNLIPKGKKPLTLNGTSKISEKCWAQATMSKAMYSFPHLFNMDESRVIFRDGHLLCGVMDKGHYGATSYGLIHCCYELYGGQVAGKMLTSLGKLFTGFLQLFGFTLGVEDILVTSKANEKRQKIIKKSRHIGSEVAAEVEALHLESVDSDTLTRELRKAHFSKDDKLIAELDNAVKKKTSEIQNSIMNACMPKGLLKRFPKNNLQLMVNSGAKGTSVNTMQISCLLGQIELEGKRPPLMLSGRFLPSFLPYDVSPKAGGFVTGRFLTGIKPQEYFFHCMAGREGLIDTAVKTSRSGYLQRCLVKHLEGVIVNYDLTVRDSDGSVIQFYYGEDSLDVMKIGFLGKNQFPFLVQNREVYPKQKYTSVRATATSSAKRLQREIQRWKATHSPNTKIQSSSFLDFCDQMDRELVTKRHYRYSGKLGRTKATQILLKAWWKLSKDEKSGFRKIASCPDPVMSRFLPYAHDSVVTELLLETVNTYCKKSLPHIFCSNESDETKEKITRDNFKKLINFKFHDSIVDPGESVGLLCAQSVGEPSTQMTLNTFHFAGCGEMNVTLGIPRLREILMVASRQVKTPTMDVPVIDTSYAQEQAKLLQKKLNKVTLSQVLQDVQVWETLATRTKGKHHRLYRVRFQFLPASVYGDYSCLTPWQVLHFVETTYLKQLWQVMNKRMSELSAANMVTSVKNTAEPGEKEESVDDVNEDAEEEEGAVEPPMNDPNQEEELMISDTDLKDDDAAAVKWRLRQMDDQDYDGEEEEIEEIIVEQQDSGVECEQDQENKPVVAQSVSSKTEADSMSGKQEDKRILGVVHQIPAIVEYQYDEEEHLWCEVTYKFNLENSKVDLMSLLKAHAQKTVVHQVAGITRSFLTEVRKNDKRTELHMQTEGINITEMSYYDNILDVNSLYCNDINAIANKYGIEAAGKAIIKEVQAVFAVYGIKVDYRHLSLLADFMTFEGIFQPFDRKRMNSCPSPIQKMTFESAMQFLIKASMHSSKDTLSSPSARLVTGRVLSCGTGNFDIVVPLIR